MRRFIYLDTDTLHSYIAQIYDGLIQTQETETQASSTTGFGNEKSIQLEGDAKFKILGKGIGAKANLAYKHLKDTTTAELISDVQTKLLHDNAFDQLIDYLNAEKAFNSDNIGDFILIEDSFYIMDLEYYQKLFTNDSLVNFIKENEEKELIAALEQQKEIQLAMPDVNQKQIKEAFKKSKFEIKSKVNEQYEDIKKTIDMLIALIPYKRTLCISNNLVVLNDSYMRDDLDMTSFKYGGKIKVLGYITNRIGDPSLTENLPELAQAGAALNEMMLSFFTKQPTLNIVHPIAIYYE